MLASSLQTDVRPGLREQSAKVCVGEGEKQEIGKQEGGCVCKGGEGKVEREGRARTCTEGRSQVHIVHVDV